MSKHVHLAGIIPLANSNIDFGVGVPISMLPINQALVVIQKSIIECAIVGCQTIWISANDDMAPIIRKVVGDWVYDPVYYNRKHRYPSEVRKEIPIYYVPILPKDRDRRDSYGWSVLSGIHSAWYVANKLSKWIVPEKYYISFPYGLYDVYPLRDYRKQISSLDNNFFMSHAGKTVKDNKYLPFTMMANDFKECRRHVNAETTKTFYNTSPGEKYPSKKLPLDERWSARGFDFSTIFSKVADVDPLNLQTDWYFQIDSWDNYVKYISSNYRIKMPKEPLTKPHKHAKLIYIKGEE
jgi:hypothetical protein